MMRPRRALHRRGAQVGSLAASHGSALPPALTARSRSLVALIVGLVVVISSVSLLVGGATLPDPLSLPVDIPGVAVNRVAAASVDLGQDAVQGSYDPCFLFTACDPIAADHRGGLAITNDHLGTDPAVRFTTSVDSRRQTNWTPADPVTERARGTRAESALLAIIETRRDDPRALLLRTAAWSRERGRTSG